MKNLFDQPSLEKKVKKFQRRTKRFKKALKLLTSNTGGLISTIFEMETSKALRLVLAHTHFQLKIRPRARLILVAMPVLALLLFTSNIAAAYFDSKKAEVKINGEPILIRENKPAVGVLTETIEIHQGITARLSPFDFKRPVSTGYLSQGFTSYHNGFDIATDFGTPITSVGSGVVEFAGFTPDGRGNEVIVDHGDGLKTLYAHMDKIRVGVGNMVDSSTVIGTVGLTGRTTGPHIHFEVYDKGITVDPGSILPPVKKEL